MTQYNPNQSLNFNQQQMMDCTELSRAVLAGKLATMHSLLGEALPRIEQGLHSVDSEAVFGDSQLDATLHSRMEYMRGAYAVRAMTPEATLNVQVITRTFQGEDERYAHHDLMTFTLRLTDEGMTVEYADYEGSPISETVPFTQKFLNELAWLISAAAVRDLWYRANEKQSA